MANKEPKNITRFPRRLLSSFRRGKKLNTQAGKNDHTRPTAEITGFTQGDLETAQNENAIIDHEATLMLDSPKIKYPVESHNIDAVTPKRNFRRVLDEDHHSASDTTPRAQRFVLGGPMSASADSGIDCSILLSEKSSPEQFVAFTRREAERLRQEHLHNGSILETLDEVDRSTVEGTDNMTEVVDTTNEIVFGDIENVNEVSTDTENTVLADIKNYNQSEGAVGYCEKDDTITIQIQSDNTCDTLPVPSACDGSGSCKTAKVNCCKETKDYFSSSCGDDVLLTENCDVRAPLFDATLYISSNKTCSVSKPEANRDSGCVNEPIDRVDDDSRLEDELVRENVTNVQLTENECDNSYLNVYANRTDEIKSAEARLRQVSSPEVELNLALTYDIVNPILVSSASIATHRVIPSTPSPARLYINENSAFAKCKSLKRSVSDVGKGILGRLRHRSKDGAEYDCKSGKVQETYKKKSGLTKRKKLGVKKEKLGTKVKLYEENDKSRVRHKSEQAAGSTKYSANMEENYDIVSLNKNISTKSPVLKELVFEQEKMNHEKSKDDFKAKQSPFYKEILSESVKASFQEQHSPVVTESIHDITAGISEMTTALCASSAESIACICDCKNRYSDPECCEKRKTPSPLLPNECVEKIVTPSNVQNDSKRNSHFELYVAVSQTEDQENLESQHCDIHQAYTIENELNEYSPMLCKNTNVFQIHENQHGQSQNSVGGVGHDICGDESSDENYSSYYEDDNDTTSSDECSDLDCSNCCNASPNTGVVDFSSSSSDSECSFSGPHENCALDNKDLNPKRESSSESSWSSQNPELVSCSSCSERGSSSPQEECSFKIEGSPYSVSFKEIDFENGDVMYLANNLNDELEKSWINDSRDSEKLSVVCATPVSSPRVCDDLSFESSLLTVNHSDSLVSDSSQNSHYQNQSLEEDVSDCSMPGSASWSEANKNILGQERSPSQSLLVPPNAEQTAAVLNQTQDSSFTNVSFDGSFADASFSVHEHRTSRFSRKSSNSYSSVLDELKDSERKYSSCSQLKLLNNSESLSDVNDSSFIDSSVRSLSHLNDSRLLQRNLRQNHNLRFNANNSIILEKSGQNVNHSFSTLESSCLRDSAFYCSASGNSLNRSWFGNHMKDFNVDMIDSRNTSLYGTSPSSSPLDLSVNKGKHAGRESWDSKKSGREWVNRHLGQVYSPAKRVLQKNHGLSETDLCKQILDLYVSDADESGFELADNEISPNSSSICSTRNTSLSGANLDDTGSDEEKLPLQYGTYVAPRNVVKETNVDDFTTTTVWTCYTGEAKTRKLPGNFYTAVIF